MLLAGLLSGCGEVYQKAYLGPWKLAGSAAVPKDPEPESRRIRFELRIEKQGEGPEIVPGSLVQAQVSGTILPSAGLPPGARFENIRDVWFWIGDGRLDEEGNRPILRLGSAGLRGAFVGARQGAVLTLRFDPRQKGSELLLPIKGFALDFTSEYRFTSGTDPQHVRLKDIGEYTLTIVRVCPAVLFQRQGILKQWGYIPHLWAESPDYPFARSGRIEFVAVEADCAGQKVRFEKGPAHRPTEGTLEMSWAESYEAAARRGRISNLE